MIRRFLRDERYIVNVDFLKSRLYDFAFIRGRFTSKRKNRIAEKIIKKRNDLHDLVLDLTQVEEADSSCPAAILRILKSVKESGKELYVCGAKTKVKDHCHLSGLDDLVKSYDSLYEFIHDKTIYTL
jgi:anti-anti-sigma factor